METKRFKTTDFQQLCRDSKYFPPDDIRRMELKAILNGIEYIDIPISVLEEMEREKARHDQWETEYKGISRLRLQGMEDEKAGNIEKAISSYRKCIEMGEQSTFNMFHAYGHAYDRLIILLHKTKQYDTETRYIEALLKHSLTEPVIKKYTERLNKLTKQ